MNRRLVRLGKAVNLNKPLVVARYISEQPWSESYKHNIVNAYNHFVEYYSLEWKRPYYKRIDRIRKIPREAQIDKVIAYARSKYALCYSILRDTGLRPVELTWLRISDIDLETGLLYPGTAKLGAGRVLKIKPSTLAMLKRYIQRHDLTQDSKLCDKVSSLTENWCRMRKRVAAKLSEPELTQIRLYDLRHFYATRLYMKTKDVLYVQRMLGHRRITHTLRYIHAVNLDREEYIVKVAQGVEDSSQLLEAGFSFVAIIEEQYVFRKPK